jgi:trimethylamine-N-oxide reductase (cytochrome c)
MSYITGVSDGVPKTPAWASAITGIPTRTIVDLAHQWASAPTTLSCYYGQTNRRAYGHQWTRAMITLQAMQGLGKPGVNLGQFQVDGNYTQTPFPNDPRQLGPHPYPDGGIDYLANKTYKNPIPQQLNYPTLFKQSIVNPPVSWTGGMKLSNQFGLDAFQNFTYPMSGYSPVHAFYMQGPSYAHIPPQSGDSLQAALSPSIEFIAVQDFRWDTGAKYADIILPTCTGYERIDMAPNDGYTRVAVYDQMPISPLGESKSDLQIYTDLANSLGFGSTFTEGNTEDDWLMKDYATTNIPMTYDQFKKKGYYVFGIAADYMTKAYGQAFNWFYNKPASQIQGTSSGIQTPTGKIEIFSTTLFAQYGVNNPDIPVIPAYIPAFEGPSDPLIKTYPLQLITPHPKFSYHSQGRNNTWLREIFKIVHGGVQYEPAWLNPTDASARGINEGDVIRVFNGRAQVLFGAHVTQLVPPGTIKIWYGEWASLTNPSDVTSLDTAGDTNLLLSDRPMSKHATTAQFTTLVEAQKWVV